jgi:hypothetical protein
MQSGRMEGPPMTKPRMPKTPKTPEPHDRKPLDERLDEQGEESFPASDPPAQPGIIGPHGEPPPAPDKSKRKG